MNIELDSTNIDYTMSVEALRRALDSLQPTDRVTVNTVGNLSVYRDGDNVGVIHLRRHHEDEPVEFWEEIDE